jgi:lysophospholipase L1-like esterase
MAAPLTYLALGDSYSIGESVPEAGRWPVQLAAALTARGQPVATPRIIAATGWTTDELAAAMDAAEPLGVYDRVSLLIGVNNQYRGRPVADYLGEFTQLLARAVALAGGHREQVWVLSIPDWGPTPFGQASGRDLAALAAELDAYNAAAAAECARLGVHFVDITPLTRRLATEPGMLADDGLHPSAAQYTRWTQRVLESLPG